MKPYLITIVLVAVLIGVTGCDRSHPGPSPTPTPPPTPTPTTPTAPAPTPPAPAPVAAVTSVRVTGNALLTAVGATLALTATATMSDGSTKDVTTIAAWTSSDPSSMSISPSGVVTVLRFGSSYVVALYNGKGTSLIVAATPPGTFVVFGRAREPGSSGIAGVLVRENTSGASILSDSEGEYSLVSLPSSRLAFEKDGFEPVTAEGKPGTYLDVAMQRVIRIAAGGKVNVSLAPHDMDYEVAAGVHCSPCKMIRITTAGATQVHLGATSADSRVALNLWINGQLFDGAAHSPFEAAADVTVGPGELIVYVGLKSQVDYYVPFTLTTAIVK